MTLVAVLAMPLSAAAHDEGHGPKLADVGTYGGVVSPVVAFKDADKGTKAPLFYKAELVRGEDGTVRVYLYDAKMKSLALDNFGKNARGTFSFAKGTQAVDLKAEGNNFIGKTTLPTKKPYDFDVVFKDKDRELLTAFDNLD